MGIFYNEMKLLLTLFFVAFASAYYHPLVHGDYVPADVAHNSYETALAHLDAEDAMHPHEEELHSLHSLPIEEEEEEHPDLHPELEPLEYEHEHDHHDLHLEEGAHHDHHD